MTDEVIFEHEVELLKIFLPPHLDID